jgi:hypothetical protein
MGDARKKRDSINLFRGAAALLLAASLLCTLAGQTLAASEPVSSPVSNNRPAVVIEGNAVVDSNGRPTGFFELSMKVRTKFYLDAEGKLVDSASAVETLDHPFRSAAVALRYDAELLTPVSWSYTPEDYAANVPGLDVSGANALKPAYLETKKPDSGVSATAKVESYTASDANNSGRPTAQLVLSAEAGGTAVSYEQETAVCVVRFKYDLDRVTMRAGDNYAFLRPAATPTGADGKKFCVVWFAEDAVAAKSSAGQSVWYQGTKSMAETVQADRTYFYYYLDAPAMTAADAPKTDGGTVFTGSPVKDYTSNLLSLQETGDPAMPGKVQFKLVNMPSYASGGVNMANMATILFYDWDDTLLGVLTVEKGDARAAVNAYVEEKMIYPDLRAGGHVGDAAYMDSLERAYTYRGTYPAEGPSGATTVTDGDEYALTNKLDYTFYRRPTELVEPAPTDPEGTAAYWEVASNASSEEAYPYVNGWAVVADIKGIENVWTTFGVGELKDVNPADASGRYTTAGTAADYFELEDFSNLSPGIHYVKACYEPGSLLDKEDNYTLKGEVSYTRYSNVASTVEGSAYSIKYQYARVSAAGVGVGRTRLPAVTLNYTTDREGTADQNFFLEVGVKNLDVMDVEFTPTGTFLTMQYALVEVYGNGNFVKGVARTVYGNALDISTNYNYKDGWNFENRLGSRGFVYDGTLNQVLEAGTRAVKTGDRAEIEDLLTYQTFQDLNLRMDGAGTQPESMFDALVLVPKFLDAIDKVLQYGGPSMLDKNGNVILDFHQLQYHILHSDTGGIYTGSGIMTPAQCIAADGGYLWCHQDECGGGATAISSLSDLLKAAYKVYDGSQANALDQLTFAFVESQYLRQDLKGLSYPSDLIDFKLALDIAIDKLVTDGPYTAVTIGTVTWKELQYALVYGAYKKDGNITSADGLWWQGGGALVPATFADLAELAFKAYADGYHPDIVKNISLQIADQNYLRANQAGGKFANVQDFLDHLAVAMVALRDEGGYSLSGVKKIRDVSWIELQHILLGNVYETETALRNDPSVKYWWENGGKQPIDTMEDLLRIAYDVYVDGGDATAISGADMAKMKALFLRETADGDPFATANGIRTALEAAVKELAASTTTTGGGYDAATIQDATYKELQYALIHGVYLPDADITETYWWLNNGGPAITTREDLLKYGYQVHVENKDKERTKNATLAFADTLYLRKDLTGAKFANQVTFDAAYKTAVQALATHYAAADIENATWKELQYALIHGTYLADGSITEDYWWENGGTKTITTLKDLLTAAYFVYGDASQPTALDGLDIDKISNAPQQDPMRLRKSLDGEFFADEAAVKGILAQLVAKVKPLGFNAATIGNLSWIEVQHMMLGNAYTTESVLRNDPNINYWWWDNDTKPTGDNPDAIMLEILVIATELDPTFGIRNDPADLTNIIAQYINGLNFQDASGNALSVSDLQTAIETMVAESYNNGDDRFWDPETAYVAMTWQEVQRWLKTGLHEKEGSFPPYDWKPTLVSPFFFALFASPLSSPRGEDIEVALPAETSEIPPIGDDVDIVPPPEGAPLKEEPSPAEGGGAPIQDIPPNDNVTAAPDVQSTNTLPIGRDAPSRRSPAPLTPFPETPPIGDDVHIVPPPEGALPKETGRDDPSCRFPVPPAASLRTRPQTGVAICLPRSLVHKNGLQCQSSHYPAMTENLTSKSRRNHP